MRYKDGKIEHDLHELLEGCSEDTKMEMIESMACDADIIKHVTAQILDRWTENCCAGSSYVTAQVEARTGLDWAWREVARRAGEVAASEIKRLEDALAHKTQEHMNALEELRSLAPSHIGRGPHCLPPLIRIVRDLRHLMLECSQNGLDFDELVKSAYVQAVLMRWHEHTKLPLTEKVAKEL